eukprot:gene449-1851_t
MRFRAFALAFFFLWNPSTLVLATPSACAKFAQNDHTWILSALTTRDKHASGLSIRDLDAMLSSLGVEGSVKADKWFSSAMNDAKAGKDADRIPHLRFHEDAITSLGEMDQGIRCQVLWQAYQSGALTVHGISKQLAEGTRLSSIAKSSRLKAVVSQLDRLAEEAAVLRVPVTQLITLYSIYPELRPPLAAHGEEGEELDFVSSTMGSTDSSGPEEL